MSCLLLLVMTLITLFHHIRHDHVREVHCLLCEHVTFQGN